MTFTLPPSDDLLAMALAEDLGVTVEAILAPRAGAPSLLDADVTSSATVPDADFSGAIVAREAGVVCGLPVVARLFELLAAAAGVEVECFPVVAEGADVEAGTAVLEIEGPARAVLAGERTALNFVMVLSGIASEARRWQRAAGSRLAVCDTRKTLPGMRALSKYAVRVGGAYNHRAGLYDMVLIKDNHVAHAGGVTDAVLAVKRAHPEMLVECEADTIAQAAEAAAAGADYVLLDNMDDATLRDAVAAVHEAVGDRVCLTEASGGITFERLAGLATTGVDRVSTSALTLARPLDFGLDARG
ncbi:MAG: carboxylating nicotinate-nucleotide diphosphorylase [Coriobacteriia bacterium]